MFREYERWEGVDWICLLPDMDKGLAVVKTVMNIRVYKLLENFSARRTTKSLLRMPPLHGVA
jgi:hypothetical protein